MKYASYAGCGCAGGEVVTLTDEVGRQQKVYSDSLGRQWKTEVLTYPDPNNNNTRSVYSTTVNVFNVRDQVMVGLQYAGSAASDASSTNEGTTCPTGTCQKTTMGYDGYGRLQTKHVPQQQVDPNNPSSTDHTTWNYNADDTIDWVKDARGAKATYDYTGTNRRLVTGITYSVPDGSSIPTTPHVGFGYDAVGNRTLMTDGLGTQSYSYNSLSQLMSETRTFNNVGSFTLSYDYNLAGELKKITDSTNMTILYGYDSSGRLNGVTGSDNLFMGVSNYASNFQYRAFGGIKAVTDGSNRTSSWLYNTRLQPSHYEVSGNLVSQDYDYYNDGRKSFVHNRTDSNFDRAYAYDYVARVAAATTGGQARGDLGATPYNESFSYDAFDNLNSRSTVSWNTDEMSDGGNYTNNRRGDWGYDANGNNTTIGSRTYQFDASGQMTQMTGQRWVINHYVNVTQASLYDGVGQKLGETTGGQRTNYLRSSVLNDAIIEELDSSGQKSVGYVYSPVGDLIAKQVTGPSGYLAWKYGSPADTSDYEVQHNSSSVTRTEVDPLGASVPLAYTPPPSVRGAGDIGAGQVGGMMDRRFANFFDVSSGCSVQGVAASCHDNASAMNNLGVMRPNLILVTINITYKQGSGLKPRQIQFVTTSDVIKAGFNHTFTDDAARAAAGAWNEGLGGGLDNALLAAKEAGFAAEADPRKYAHAPQKRSDTSGDKDIKSSQVNVLHEGLTPCVKEYLSKFFDKKLLDQINVHRDELPAIVPEKDDTSAYTASEHDIWFNKGQYSPNTPRGIALIGHEVEHTYQWRKYGASFGLLYLGDSAGVFYMTGNPDLAYPLNRFELSAQKKEKQILDDIRKNGNPCP